MDAYAWQSKVYDLVLEPVNAPIRRVVQQTWPMAPGWLVVDIACGTGAALAEYQAAGCRVIGTDVSAAMLAQARNRLGPEADLRRIAGPGVPVEDGCADGVLVSLVLHSLDRGDARQLLTEAARIAAPGGSILVTDFGVGQLRFPRGYLTRGLAGLAEAAAGPAHARHCLAYLRAGGLPSLAAEAGLEVRASRPTAGGNLTLALLGAEP
jgi:ubiquinone/menaquinone biosynthesis C-methylase UbiE